MLKIKGELDAALALQTLLGSNSCFYGRDRSPSLKRPIPVVPKSKSTLRYYSDPQTGELLMKPKKRRESKKAAR